jgi:hypothetical protein
MKLFVSFRNTQCRRRVQTELDARTGSKGEKKKSTSSTGLQFYFWQYSKPLTLEKKERKL